MKTLVIAAHPDDEVLGCGGTIAKLAKEGSEVHIAILGEGITSRFPEREQASREDIEQLHQHAREAGEMLGAKQVHLIGLPDNRFDTLPLLKVVKIVEELIDKIRPVQVYTHHPGDLNVDHGVVHRAVLTATRPVEGHPVRDLYAFEVPSSTEWAFHQLEPRFRPNVFINIADTLDQKIKAMVHYEGEARAFPHPRSSEALRATAQRWGSVVGYEAAEAFELIRSLRDHGVR
jgi:LmbE family N-acetylglucosaminyl deacetylase